MLRSINLFITLVLETFKLFGRVKAWLFLLTIVLVQWLILYAHYQFTLPVFYGAVTWWTQLWDPQYAGGFTHYPGHFVLLAYYFSSAKLIVGFFIEGGFLGAVAVVFYEYIFSDIEKQPFSLQNGIKRWLHLSLAWGIMNGILYLGYVYLPKIFATLLWSSPRRQMIFDFGVIPLFNILIFALFFFAISYIAVYRTNFLVGIKNSLLLFIERPIFMLFVSTCILIVPLVLSLMLNDTSVLVQKFKPVFVYWALTFTIIVDMFVNFFWIGIAINYLADDE